MAAQARAFALCVPAVHIVAVVGAVGLPAVACSCSHCVDQALSNEHNASCFLN